jgi:predicted RNase H-like HicB family nuclease
VKYLIIIEPSATGSSAYSPDLPGCAAVGSTQQEVQRNMREALQFHVDGLRAEHLPVPAPSSSSAYVDVPA